MKKTGEADLEFTSIFMKEIIHFNTILTKSLNYKL